MTIPRSLIDRIFEQITNHDLVDKWNYPTQAAREFFDHLKSGKTLDPNQSFLEPSRFSKFNGISSTELYEIVFPAFEETKDSVLDSIISDFDGFLVKLKAQVQTAHAKAIYADGHPQEDLGRQIVSAAVFGYFSDRGFVYHEVPSGIGFMDILICAEREIVIEVKLHSNFDPQSRQLEEYVRGGAGRYGYYMVFDTTRGFTNKEYCDIENGRFPPK